MKIPIQVKVNCLLETGKTYPTTEEYSAEQYVLDTMAYNLGIKMMAELPLTIMPSEELLPSGQPISLKYTVEANVFTDTQLNEFVGDIKKAVKFDIQAKEWLENCKGPIV